MTGKQTILESISDDKCTGCSACMNICPTDALRMTENDEGFIFPGIDSKKCIHCGLCVSVCPALTNINSNQGEPDCYAFRAPDELRRKSASGGAFSVLAQAFLDMGGFVVGAAFDAHQRLRHVMTNKPEDLNPIRGSKYLQSDINYIYRQVKEKLETGTEVLFSGTPCQVAALYSYLGKPQEKLLTVDLLCFGVPSQTLFHRYLQEKAPGRQIKQIFFRKKAGKEGPYFSIEYQGGAHYTVKSENDPFYDGFLKMLYLRKACKNCKYATIPRVGDISIGDFWGFSNLEGGDRLGGGTSLILINNSRGKQAVEIFTQNSELLKKMSVDPRTLPNQGLRPLRPEHTNRGYFFDLASRKPFWEALEKSKGTKFDVGIVGPYQNSNMGGFLTYYALYHLLRDMGLTVYLIQFPENAPWQPRPPLTQTLEKNPYPSWAMAPNFPTLRDMRRLNGICEAFVVGSDQVFNPPMHYRMGKVCMLGWVKDTRKKIAFAASFGLDWFNGTNETRAEMSYFLKKFDGISVREKSGIDICRETLDVEASHVMDPVFLCNESHWKDLADSAAIQNDPEDRFIFLYYLDVTEPLLQLLEEVSAGKNLSYRLYSHLGTTPKCRLHGIDDKIEGRVRDMRDARFFITDSFHGTCYALIFRKDFIVWGKDPGHEARMVSLLEDVGLSNRIVRSMDDFHNRKDELMECIDFEGVYERLQPKIDASRAWLERQLGKEKKMPLSDYDAITTFSMNLYNELGMRMRKLEKRLLERIDDINRKIE